MARPIVALLLFGSLALQLVLAGVGATCVMPGGDGAQTASADMSGMDMGGMPSGEDDPSPGNGPDGSPCDQPGTPQTCQVMAPCAGGFVLAARGGADAAAGVPAAMSTASVAAPASRTIPPEPPPPRA